jgi:hypothetical protein
MPANTLKEKLYCQFSDSDADKTAQLLTINKSEPSAHTHQFQFGASAVGVCILESLTIFFGKTLETDFLVSFQSRLKTFQDHNIILILKLMTLNSF